MVRRAIQLFTLRDLDEPLEATLERVADTNYSGVEFAGLDDNSAESIASKLDELGLDAVAAHVGVEVLESEYDDVVETYGTLGCDRLVVPTYDVDAFTTREGVDAAADRLSELAARLDQDGFDLLYHNHTFEFTEFDGTTAMDRFVEKSSDLVRLEVDTGLAAHAGVDPSEFIERHIDSLSLLHLTDTRRGSDDTLHVDLGDGEVDLGACIESARDSESEWVIFENGKTADPLESLAQSDAALDELLDE